MAWRMLRKKVYQQGLNANFLNAFLYAHSKSGLHFFFGSHGRMLDSYIGLSSRASINGRISSNIFNIRNFHATTFMLAWRRKEEEVPGLKVQRKEKQIRRENRNQAPVEAPYVPTKKLNLKPSQDKIIEIFEGMTIHELAKRTGSSIGALLEILINVGEKVDSEFDPISVDIAELAAMVFVNVVHVGVGPISQSDIDLAVACGACIVGFNIRNPPSSITLAANKANIKICLHRIIYHLLEDIGKIIVEKAPGTCETKVGGEAEVLSIFELKGRSKSKGPDVKIAGCRVVDGRFIKSSTMRLLRSGEFIFEGSCASLKRGKQDVDAVGKGTECGLVIQDCDDFQVGDVIQCLEHVIRKPKFISSESGTVRIEC